MSNWYNRTSYKTLLSFLMHESVLALNYEFNLLLIAIILVISLIA